MMFEFLFESDYLKNFSNFHKCKDLWKDMDEDKVKNLFSMAYKLSCETEKEPREYLIWENAIQYLNDGLVIRLPFHFIRLKNDLNKCPLCGCSYKGLGAISRRDNETEICGNCGTKEAMEDLLGYRE